MESATGLTEFSNNNGGGLRQSNIFSLYMRANLCLVTKNNCFFFVEANYSMNLQNYLIGCIIGPNRSIMNSIQNESGAKLTISDRNGDSYRKVTISGTTHAVRMAADSIKEK